MIRKATKEDLPAIVDLHSRVLSWSINGRLGREHIAAIYECLFAGDDIIAYVAVRNGQLLAFQISTTDFLAVRHRFSTLLGFRRKARLILSCLWHPFDLVALFETAFLVVPIMRRTGYTAEIVSWACEPENAVAVLGAHDCLMNSLKTLSEKGEAYCLAQFQKPNERPHTYLKKLGIVPVRNLLRYDIFLVKCRPEGKKHNGTFS